VSETDANADGVSLVHADLVKSGFAQRVSDLASAAARVQGGEDPEAIHDLRVSARSLDAMSRAWAGLLGARPRSAALRALRRLRRRPHAGRARLRGTGGVSVSSGGSVFARCGGVEGGESTGLAAAH